MSLSVKRWLLFLWNYWPPFWGTGIHIDSVSPDFLFVRVCLKWRLWTRNYVGTQFGGSIYAMTDAFYMVMLLQNLGPDYIVWDKAATVRFRKPGRSTLIAEFSLTCDDILAIQKRLAAESKMDWERDVIVKNLAGETIAEIHKVLSIRKKEKTS